MSFSRQKGLMAKIYSEGYCCLSGYLRLCKARGETSIGMAENIGVSKFTIWHHERRLRDGKISCQKRGDCLCNIIQEIEADPPKRADEEKGL